ncbi:FecR domain-containing protein [Iodobacter fluviatilis]|uniref:FecR family protein n=1 Tax=Iodobacter fluviatilis TaxID=537 RepID=A0A377SXS3_9NEIS|nr:FecR domain-containing protein [Iodobacter fluviatilis]TCU85017.1 FecR family protein [Iodobacter fluviatilis]STR45299.1 FecR protein [Iodobacter fluviatilis]
MRLVLLMGLLLASLAHAGPAIVESVQLPAWVERSEIKKPLSPQMQLLPGDRITTGAGARVYLLLPEGSRVKLGENAHLFLDQLNEANGKEGSVFKAALKMVTGAFRFTTNALNKNSQREVKVTVAAVTAGIRGTDLWGKADSDKDVVCLLEGKISVAAEGRPQVELNEPLSFYIAPHDQEPLPVGKVEPEKLKKWAAETEIENHAGVLAEKGPWRITWANYASADEALVLYDRLQQAGYPVKIRSQARRYRVVLAGLTSEADARAVVGKVHAQFTTPLAEVRR